MLLEDGLLLAGLALATFANLKRPRALGWLAAIATSYALSAVWWRTGLPAPAFVGGVLDALICLAIYFLGRFRWEMVIWRLFQFSVLVNLVTLAGDYGLVTSLPHNAHSFTMEVINWLALAWIGVTGAAQSIGAAHVPGHRLISRVLGFVAALYRERTQPPFTHVKGKAAIR